MALGRNEKGQFVKGLIPWNTGLKGVSGWPKGKKRWTDKPNPMLGKKHSEATKQKISKLQKGRSAWNKGKTFLVGSKNPNWKGGINPINLTIRKSKEYAEWIKKVYERDNYICQICDKLGEGDLNANHIKKFSCYPELRFEISNGITLCKSCHIHLVNQHEEEWESYFKFNLETK